MFQKAAGPGYAQAAGMPSLGWFLYLFSCLLALNSRCTAWSFSSLLPARYSLITPPVQVSFLSGKFHSCAGTCSSRDMQHTQRQENRLDKCHADCRDCVAVVCSARLIIESIVRTPLCCSASTSFLACVLLPLRSTPSKRMKAPRGVAGMVMVVLQAALAVTNLNVLEVMQPSLRVVQTLSIQRGGQPISHN